MSVPSLCLNVYKSYLIELRPNLNPVCETGLRVIHAGLKSKHRRCAGTGAASALSGLASGSPAGRGGGCSPRSARGWCPEAQTLDNTRPAAAHRHTHSAEPASDAS